MQPEIATARRLKLIRDKVHRQKVLRGVSRVETVRQPDHPWQTTARRWAMPGERVTPRSRLWRVDVAPGCVNDKPALITYRKQGDPRGWTMPDDYRNDDSQLARYFAPTYPLVDRSPYETPQPFLMLEAPSASGDDPGDFEPVQARARPLVFRSQQITGQSALGRIAGGENQQVVIDYATYPLYKASVIVSAQPYRSTRNFTPYEPSANERLDRFRVLVGRLPTRNDVARAGLWCEVARLWLLRNPHAPLIQDRLFIGQRRFYSMWNTTVEPSLGLGESFTEDYSLGLLPLTGLLSPVALLPSITTDLILSQANQTMGDAARVEFWSV